MEYYSRPGELLEKHLGNVATLCGDFCSEFTSRHIGELIGWLHDAGKRTKRFQGVLLGKESHINHAIIGAMICKQKNFDRLIRSDANMVQIVARIISAHHSEMQATTEDCSIPDKWDDEIYGKLYAVSSNDEMKDICRYYRDLIASGSIHKITQQPNLDSQSNLKNMLFERMLFSCLVDADYSSVAMFYDSNYLIQNTGNFCDKADVLNSRFSVYYKDLIRDLNPHSAMNALRNRVYNDCSAASELPSGLYQLTAPTGSGKTLAMMNFAIQHAKRHSKQRIFVVLPYLSIISQTVNLYKNIFGDDMVLEDDSQVENLQENQRELSSRWSAPIIIPTMVKFLEVLFDSKAVSIRKLHNICNSVIMIDEFQSIPAHILGSTLNALRELSDRYNCTVLFASATPPNFSHRYGLEWWQNKVREVCFDVQSLYNIYSKARPIHIQWDNQVETTTKKIAEKLDSFDNVGCIVNTKRIAEDVFTKLQNRKNIFLISTNLCSAHRTNQLSDIAKLQENKQRVCVVATQCIEAGVDMSVAHMWREVAPLSSIIQAAGRCARNGECVGDFHVFSLQDAKFPDSNYENAQKITSHMIKTMGGLDVTNLAALEMFYKKLYGLSGFASDKQELIESINEYDFHAVRQNYHVIEKDKYKQIRIVVPYKREMQRYQDFSLLLEQNDYTVSMSELRKIQCISVSTTDISLAKYCVPIFTKAKHCPQIQTDMYFLPKKSFGLYYDNCVGLRCQDTLSLII